MKALLKPVFTPLNEKEITRLCTQTQETVLNSSQLKKFTAVDMWNIQRGRKGAYKRNAGGIF